MSGRLAFQTQLASIMEVLANAAVAEICKLVDDDYAVVSLQMSQCQRENRALKRKLHLLELKMARGNAERRLREAAGSSSRTRVQVTAVDRLRESASTSSCTDGGFGDRMDVVVWTGGAAAGGTELIHSEHAERKSSDVELVDPELDEVALVKGEKVEANISRVKVSKEEEDVVSLIRDDGVVECVPSRAAEQRPGLQQQDTQSTPSQIQNQTQTQTQSVTPGSSRRRCAGSRGVEEEEDDVVLVKVEEGEEVRLGDRSQTGLSIQEGLVESSTDDFRAALPFDETTQTSTNQLSDLPESGRGFSEPAAPQSTPVMSHDPCSAVAVQLALPDAPPDPEQRSRNPLSSEYSLFDLETFFTRWAPDSGSLSAPGGPSCSFSNDDSAEGEQDGVIIVESEDQHVVQPPQGAAVRLSRGPSCAAEPSRVQQTRPHGPSVSAPLRMQTPAAQPPWGRASALMRSTQYHRLHGRMTTAPSVGSTCRPLGSSEAPPIRGSTSASVSIGIPAQHRSSFLSRHNKSLAASLMSGEGRRKSYVCRACGKAFTGLSNLEAHERVHTGEKPFNCDTCGKRFSEAGNLKKHQRVHTGEKPFSCQQCGKRFAWICNLRTHQQSASGCGPQARGPQGLS
ncbi:zinc finger protein 853-like isoform X1 [Notolabrus celidotus]|uniref:zinc finger protein 853-like isoform X1 n=1 Tax=Notolabrus celidotus TaxID=1203425 RepID=UPI00148FA418|nr:zinc finger protein 853-like isoform X1 [Notolabrus celidotus]